MQRRGARDHDQRRYRAHQGEQDRPARGPALRATSGRPRSTRSAATWRCPDTPPARCFAGCCAVATAVANRSARTASGGSFASGLRPYPAAAGESAGTRSGWAARSARGRACSRPGGWRSPDTPEVYIRLKAARGPVARGAATGWAGSNTLYRAGLPAIGSGKVPTRMYRSPLPG